MIEGVDLIITFPTALYSPVLPKKNTDSQSITYTVSSEDPPRYEQTYNQIPYAEEIKPLPDRIYTEKELRTYAGELVFTVSKPSEGESGSNVKQFEVGQFIDFGDVEDIQELNTQNVPNVIELTQNTNVLDYQKAGLSQDEANLLISLSEDKMNKIIGELNAINATVNDNQTKITENQKELNEVRKMINATELVIDSSTSEILDKLKNQEQALLLERESLITSTNELIDFADERFSELLKIREVVR